ncbi:type I restriction endonuclease subunit R [Bradyrhizobium amphicarpaeae]|uniref:Type I restriction endonuclease subunit R n=1 Tax=Bradyrhizobium amphicarpaeae TaxID=1404768 RepID=A0A2U8Q359_9BRAD|nr:type I restriction endonuclease subunit R [Bradyrhizobium amphicarpaeae]AWM04422.1 type I restriction endonuclease subunit R [Bradyrhizobium amphicarpaeae]
MTTDISEKGLEALIVADMTGRKASASGGFSEDPDPFAGLHNWLLGDPKAYDRVWTVDLVQLRAFIAATQPLLVPAFDLDHDSPVRQKFLARLQGEIGKRGVIDVLRKGLKHGAHNVDLFYGTPSLGNPKAAERFALNRFSVTRQLRYSRDDTAHALDLALFINGLPIATFELKNSLTKQTVEDAVEQYKRDRDPREKLFEFGRCIVHLAVDDAQVMFCTQLKGKASWFLPFNRGWNDGAGNPPNPAGIKTDYLWKDILTPLGLTDIVENYAQIVERKDPKTNRTKRDQLFPRFHQLDVVRKLLADARAKGAGRRVLIQHSAGSGKSNSIAWLAHQLVRLANAAGQVFDSVIVVTDRRILDQQIRDTIKQFAQVGATVGHAEHSGDLRRFIADGKKIIITTVQKFPFILDDIGSQHKDRRFAIIIDEAHSSQGGRAAAALNAALTGAEDSDEDDTVEDKIIAIMESRKMLPNASYFAFTATPKNKTLEIFGEPWPEGDKVKHRPFHSYTMKQAIQEGFILDVLRYYTPVNSYYRLVKTVEADPEFDTKRATKKLRRYVESNSHAIRLKAEIMVDHFHEQVLALNKIGGQARAMVVTSGIERAIEYYQAVSAYLIERKSPYRAIVAFSGEHEFKGAKVTEASLNGFPSKDIADRIEVDPYRFLICADKFQTGYDQPLLHTMYVDKALSSIKAVQTLSRLNRAHPQKHDTFVLDFMNDAETIRAAFDTFYRTTILSDETDPNRLHDLKAGLDEHQVYEPAQIEQLVGLYLDGADRDRLDPILDVCVETYVSELDEDGQVDFKGKAKAFTRTYAFISSLLPYTNADWEKLSIFLNFLVPKLPAPREEDLSKGILEAIDMDSYRVEKQATQRVQLIDQDAEIDPVPTDGGGHRAEPELDRLSNIIRSFNDLFGNITWADTDRIRHLIATVIPDKVAANPAYQNAQKNSDKQNARIEHDKALASVIIGLMKDDTELFKQFSDNPEFKRWLTDTVFTATYDRPTP